MSALPTKKYAHWLWLLLTLFILRVVAQLIALYHPLPFLPNFEDWHSGILPYWVLLSIQVSLTAIMTTTNVFFSKGRVTPRRLLGNGLYVFGALYFGIMITRLVLGLTLFSTNRWFTNCLPILFHLVLAAYVLTIANFHRKYSREHQHE